MSRYNSVPDQRVTAYGIFNSGNLDPGQTSSIMPQIDVPIFFFLGGPSDIAYGNVSLQPSQLLAMG